MKYENKKPVIESIVNTVALGITSTGMFMILNRDLYGFILILFALLIEWFKYFGRLNKLW